MTSTVATQAHLVARSWSHVTRTSSGAASPVRGPSGIGAAHPTHLSIAEAVRVALDIGAEQTYFTHLTHDNFHADLAAELPARISPAYDGLVVTIDPN